MEQKKWDDIPNLTDRQLDSLYGEGKFVTISFMRFLLDKLEIQDKAIKSLQTEIQELKARLAIDSHNSSKPPSSDGYKKKGKQKGKRKKGNKKPGGQNGHKGSTLGLVPNPNDVITHKVNCCKKCGASLENVPATFTDIRQVFDLLNKIAIGVTEHRAEEKDCHNCGEHNKADFPDTVTHKTQYGEELKAIAVYLSNYQLIPYDRLCELFEDIFNISLSPATLVNTNRNCSELLEEPEAVIKEKIIASDVVRLDETGCNIASDLYWIHVAGTEFLTYYFANKKRGKIAMDAMGILSVFKGTAVHDHLKAYFLYTECAHALCNAHHLRELTFIYEECGQEWANKMILLLLKIKEAKEKSGRQKFKPEIIKEYEREYKRIINQGLKANPSPEIPEEKKRGRRKKTKAGNLLERFEKYSHSVLAFMYDFNVPFDNNQAERDLRMHKVKQKISCLYRSMEGANSFCRIRGFISTIKKNQLNVMDAIKGIFKSQALALVQAL
jgi:transposase